jgi:sarcosine oxidase/L-pipecolate oxidase
MASDSFGTPSSVLIVGSGVFGLATAHAICKNPHFKDTAITVVDRQPFPTPDGSSVSALSVPSFSRTGRPCSSFSIA